MDRRDFIKMLGIAGTSATAYAACSNYMSEALAQSTSIDELLSTAAHCQGGSLEDVEHVIFLMQENRSFDHYYGTLRGVRGFGDPRPLKLKTGGSVFEQPKFPPIESLSYTLNAHSWQELQYLIASQEPATIKRHIKDMIAGSLPALLPQIDALPDDFILRLAKGDWDSILPANLAGKTIPDLLDELKTNLSAVENEDVDPAFAKTVKTVLTDLADNTVVVGLIGKMLGSSGMAVDSTSLKSLLGFIPDQGLVVMLVKLLANFINVDGLRTSWPAAVKVVPSLAKGLPKPGEIFRLLQDVIRQFKTHNIIAGLPADPMVALPPFVSAMLPKNTLEYLTEEAKTKYPQFITWLKGEGQIRPFQVRRGNGSAGEYKSFGLPHTYDDARDAVNNGCNDQWLLSKGNMAMAHLDAASDLAFYNKLVSSFTICDGYHCSVHSGTDPNRSHFWTGTAGGWTVNAYFSSKVGSRPTWKTYPEKLWDHGVEWKFYQNGLGGADEFFGNFDDNTLQFFAKYQDADSPLALRTLSMNSVLRTDPDVPSQFEKDVVEGKLPPVSWISAPTAFSEHPGGISPHFGEYYVNEILKVLAAHPEVWKKTVFIINYDENDGFFDHVPPPLPPLPTLNDVGKVSDGIVISASADVNDFNTEHATKLVQDLLPPDYARYPASRQQLAMGLGNRVPCLIISPWTVGGRVCSELFDHTSTLRFLDTWLAAKGWQTKSETFANISSWRRAICGDLTSAFDFTRKLEDTAKESKSKLDAVMAAAKPVPAYQTIKDQDQLKKELHHYKDSEKDIATDLAKETRLKQDRTQVDLLPLDYDFNVYASVAANKKNLTLTFKNRGKLGVALNVYSYLDYDKSRGAWFYALIKAVDVKTPVVLADNYDLVARGGKYEFAVHAPNGYLSEFRGDTTLAGQLQIADIVDVQSADNATKVRFDFSKWPGVNGDLTMVNAYTKETATVAAGTVSVSGAAKDGWYDISFTDKAGTGYLRRYAGHLENGKISRSDPAIGLQYDEKKRVYVAVTA